MENTQTGGDAGNTAVQCGSCSLMTGSCLCQHGMNYFRALEPAGALPIASMRPRWHVPRATSRAARDEQRVRN